MKTLHVWDLPLRLFKWALAGFVVAAFVSGFLGGNAMDWHARFGLAILALLIFRVLWGFFGSTYARFRKCLPHPRAVLASLRGGSGDREPGHTPTGKLALIIMFGVLWLQTGTGLFANDDIALEGPLYHLVSKARSDWLTGLHKYAIYVIGGIVVLHVAAILYYYLVKKDNLVAPMIRGWRRAPIETPDELAAQGGSTLLGLILMAASAGLVWSMVEFL